ncbi:MAG: ribonucleotide-diphosphate reductase subunit beta [Methanobrevibacter sp.]|jgi:U3 small nucleolar ribonucleoprotein protein IMP4|nr:ribonucleotide-diphosphate reductase subunit beta [Candidatus Methanovirga basalitermitum]
MIISTSRRPSQKTRKFCKNLSTALGYKYMNRGKMSLRDLCLKSLEKDKNSITIISEVKGNPSKISFLSNEGSKKLELNISANLNNGRLNIKADDLSFKCSKKGLEFIADILSIKKNQSPINNYILVRNHNKRNSIAIIEFYDDNGNKTELKIAIKSLKSY